MCYDLIPKRGPVYGTQMSLVATSAYRRFKGCFYFEIAEETGRPKRFRENFSGFFNFCLKAKILNIYFHIVKVVLRVVNLIILK